MSTYKRLNIISDRSGPWVSIIRGGKIRRYHPTPASLARCRCLIRAQLAALRET